MVNNFAILLKTYLQIVTLFGVYLNMQNKATMNKKRFQQYLAPSVLERLKVEAKKQRRSAASLAEIILDDHLPKHQPDEIGEPPNRGGNV